MSASTDRNENSSSGQQQRESNLRPENEIDTNANPESLEISDEEQRRKSGEHGRNADIPTGNEKSAPKTEGSESGVGE